MVILVNQKQYLMYKCAILGRNITKNDKILV